MDDVRAVMDAANCERAALFGISEGGPMSLLFAATYPERASALVLYGSHARHPTLSADNIQQHFELIEILWGTGEYSIRSFAPSRQETRPLSAALRAGSDWARLLPRQYRSSK